MAQPQRYDRKHDFTQDEEFSGQPLNGELDNAAVAINGIRENLAKIQKDDGTLQNGIVTEDTLGADVIEKFQQITQDAKNAALEGAKIAEEAAEEAKDAAEIAKESAETATRAEESASLNAETAAENLNKISEVAELIDPFLQNSEEVIAVGENIDSVVNVDRHMDEVHTVGQDLQGVNADDLDLDLLPFLEMILHIVDIGIGDL